MNDSRVNRYIRCQGKKNQLPCWHWLHSRSLVSGFSPGLRYLPLGARPCTAARYCHDRLSSGRVAGSVSGGSQARIAATPFWYDISAVGHLVFSFFINVYTLERVRIRPPRTETSRGSRRGGVARVWGDAV